jgi:membrane protein implicated in regulation of membrane protease activity
MPELKQSKLKQLAHKLLSIGKFCILAIGYCFLALAAILLAVVAFVPTYVVAIVLSYRQQVGTNSGKDLVLNEKNEIIEGAVKPHWEVRQPRPQPTWMN